MEALPEIKNLKAPAPGHWSAGQPTEAQLAAFAHQGGRRVISLRPPAEMPNTDEAAVVDGLSMRFARVAIPNAEALTRDNAERLDALLAEAGDEPVLLHCGSGNRVGALMAVRAGWLYALPAREAVALGRAYGMTDLEPKVEQLLTQP